MMASGCWIEDLGQIMNMKASGISGDDMIWSVIDRGMAHEAYRSWRCNESVQGGLGVS
jgi:hypothetical protein